jgi:prepilin-type N-terminal cleavage/methylation domain-containing protein
MPLDFQRRNFHFSQPVRLAHRMMRGFSMTEMVVTISVIGVLAGIAITQIGGALESSKVAAANEKLEMVNQGLHAYASAVKSLTNGDMAVRADANDEIQVLLTLQYRDPNNPVPGSPFVDEHYRPSTSSNSADYRLQWAGGLFRLLTPGQSGAGLKVPFDGSDLGDPFKYPVNFHSLGR